MNSSKTFLLSDGAILTIASTAINLILSLPTNSFVVWLMATGAGGTLMAEFLPLNLAVFEILFCLLSVGRLLVFSFPSVKLLSTFATGFLLSGRPVLQSCICLEQYLAVVHPVLFLRYKPLRYKVAFSGVAWALIVGLSVCYLLFPLAKHLVFVSECVIVILVMLFCYLSVLVALKRPRPGEGNKERNNDMKRKAFLTVFVIISTFVGTYFFWCVSIFSNLSSWFSNTRKLFLKSCTFITIASGFVQPLFYLHRTGTCPCSKAVRICTG